MQRFARWFAGVALGCLLGMGLLTSGQPLSSGTRSVYAEEATPTPTPLPDPNCGSLGCGGG